MRSRVVEPPETDPRDERLRKLTTRLAEVERRGGPVHVTRTDFEIQVSIGNEMRILTSLSREDEAMLIIAMRDDVGTTDAWPDPNGDQLLATIEHYLEIKQPWSVAV